MAEPDIIELTCLEAGRLWRVPAYLARSEPLRSWLGERIDEGLAGSLPRYGLFCCYSKACELLDDTVAGLEVAVAVVDEEAPNPVDEFIARVQKLKKRIHPWTSDVIRHHYNDTLKAIYLELERRAVRLAIGIPSADIYTLALGNHPKRLKKLLSNLSEEMLDELLGPGVTEAAE